MKKLLIVFASVAITIAAQAQGTVNFNNRVSSFGVDAPVILGLGGIGPGPGPTYSAGLWYNGSLVPGSVTTFRDGTSNPLLAKYINGLTVTLPSTTAGQQNVQVEMRAWPTSAGSYDAATVEQRGTSGALTIATLGGGTDPTANNNFPSTFTGFTIPPIPEPSTLALGVLGFAALLLRRRK
jgi:hypothetical protein